MISMYLSWKREFGQMSTVAEEPKLVLILSAFHHSITLAGLGGLPSDMTQTFIPGYLNLG